MCEAGVSALCLCFPWYTTAGESVAKERRLDRCRGNLLPSSCNVWSHSASSRCAHCVHVFFSLCEPLEEGRDIFDTWKCRDCHKNNISYVRFTYGHLETAAHTPFPLNSAIFMRRNTFATKYKRDAWSLRWKRNIKHTFWGTHIWVDRRYKTPSNFSSTFHKKKKKRWSLYPTRHDRKLRRKFPPF